MKKLGLKILISSVILFVTSFLSFKIGYNQRQAEAELSACELMDAGGTVEQSQALEMVLFGKIVQ